MEIIEKRNKKEGFNPKQMRKVRKIEFNYLIPKKMLINRSSLKGSLVTLAAALTLALPVSATASSISEEVLERLNTQKYTLKSDDLETRYVYPKFGGKYKVMWDEFDWQVIELESLVPEGWTEPLVPDVLGKLPSVVTTETFPNGVPIDKPEINVLKTPDDPSKRKELTDGIQQTYVIFPQEFEELGQIVAEVIEKQQRKLEKLFNRYGLKEDLSIYIVPSASDFGRMNDLGNESALGVTSLQTLNLAFFFDGNLQRSSYIFTHEMTHEFTIQVANELKRRWDLKESSLNAEFEGGRLFGLPLMYIEGLAEIAGHQLTSGSSKDPDMEMYMKDLVLNNAPMSQYSLSYQFGQMFLHFLNEEYGSGTAIDILFNSFRMKKAMQPEDYLDEMIKQSEERDRRRKERAGIYEPPSERERLQEKINEDKKTLYMVIDWLELLELVTGDSRDDIDKKLIRYMLRKYSPEQLRLLDKDYNDGDERLDRLFVGDMISVPLKKTLFSDSNNFSPDGQHMISRRFNPQKRRAELVIQNLDDMIKFTTIIDHDYRLDLEMLGLQGSLQTEYNMATISDTQIAYTGLSDGGKFAIFIREYQLVEKKPEEIKEQKFMELLRKHDPAYMDVDVKKQAPKKNKFGEFVEIKRWGYDLGKVRKISFHGEGIKEVVDLSFSPDGNSIVFSGLLDDGRRDIFIYNLENENFRRMTNDLYNDRGNNWGKRGIVFTSDRTSDGNSNLFLMDPETGKITRLTFEPRNHLWPRFMLDGNKVAYTAYEEKGTSNLFVVDLDKNETFRATDVLTGVFSPTFKNGKTENESLVSFLGFENGRYRIVAMPLENLVKEDVKPIEPIEEESLIYNRPRKLFVVNSFDQETKNRWHLGAIAVGASSDIEGEYQEGSAIVYFHDDPKNQIVYGTININGQIEYGTAFANYINQKHRLIWGAGVYHFASIQKDWEFDPRDEFPYYIERNYGGHLILQWPLGLFAGLQNEIGVGCKNNDHYVGASEEEWENKKGGDRPYFSERLVLTVDNLRYHPYTGPIQGNSLVLQGALELDLKSSDVNHLYSFDANHYTHLGGSGNIRYRLFGGVSLGDIKDVYYTSARYNVGALEEGDDRLYTERYLGANMELQLPLDSLVNFFLAQNIEGIIGVDAWSGFNHNSEFSDNFVANTKFGVNVMVKGMPGIVFRFTWAYPFMGKELSDGSVNHFDISWAQ